MTHPIMEDAKPPPFRAFYDASSDMFVVEFLDEATFGPPLAHYRWSMFTHGVCADVTSEVTFTPTWRYLGITGWQVYKDTLAEDINYRIDSAALAMEHMYAHVKEGDELAPSRRRCEAAARLLTEHRNAIVAELIASRGRARMDEWPDTIIV